MKKTILLFIIISLILSSCTFSISTKKDSNLQNAETKIELEGNTSIDYSTFLIEASSAGNEVTALNPTYFVTNSNSISAFNLDELKVYKTKYPVDDSGEKFEITSELIEKEKKLLIDFLNLHYEDYNQEKYPIVERTIDVDGYREIQFSNDSIQISSRCEMLLIRAKNDGWNLNNILDCNIVKESLELMNIANPEIIESYNESKEASTDKEFIIIESTNNDLEKIYRCNFQKLRIVLNSDSIILTIKNETPEETSVFSERIYYQELLEYLKKTYCPVGDIYSTIEYSSSVNIDYYIPCIKFIYHTENLDNNGNSIIEYKTFRILEKINP